MNIFRIAGVLIGLLFSFFALVYMLIGLGIYTSAEPVQHRVANCILACVPFSLSFWFVYRCFRTEGMKAWEILCWTVYPRALISAAVAELCGLVIAALVVALLSLR